MKIRLTIILLVMFHSTILFSQENKDALRTAFFVEEIIKSKCYIPSETSKPPKKKRVCWICKIHPVDRPYFMMELVEFRNPHKKINVNEVSSLCLFPIWEKNMLLGHPTLGVKVKYKRKEFLVPLFHWAGNIYLECDNVL